jgi:P27 family predicted phage terminase small subunit
MGRRGPPPTPTKLKLLRGNPGKRPINRQEPTPAANLPVQPEEMSPESQAVWARILRDYGATGVLTGVDTDALRIYCEAVVRYEYAAVRLERSGPLVRGAERRGGELVKNPLHQIVRDNADLVRAFARELGFTPAARSALTSLGKPDENDPLAEWLAR